MGVNKSATSYMIQALGESHILEACAPNETDKIKLCKVNKYLDTLLNKMQITNYQNLANKLQSGPYQRSYKKPNFENNTLEYIDCWKGRLLGIYFGCEKSFMKLLDKFLILQCLNALECFEVYLKIRSVHKFSHQKSSFLNILKERKNKVKTIIFRFKDGVQDNSYFSASLCLINQLRSDKVVTIKLVFPTSYLITSIFQSQMNFLVIVKETFPSLQEIEIKLFIDENYDYTEFIDLIGSADLQLFKFYFDIRYVRQLGVYSKMMQKLDERKKTNCVKTKIYLSNYWLNDLDIINGRINDVFCNYGNISINANLNQFEQWERLVNQNFLPWHIFYYVKCIKINLYKFYQSMDRIQVETLKTMCERNFLFILSNLETLHLSFEYAPCLPTFSPILETLISGIPKSVKKLYLHDSTCLNPIYIEKLEQQLTNLKEIHFIKDRGWPKLYSNCLIYIMSFQNLQILFISCIAKRRLDFSKNLRVLSIQCEAFKQLKGVSETTIHKKRTIDKNLDKSQSRCVAIESAIPTKETKCQCNQIQKPFKCISIRHSMDGILTYVNYNCLRDFEFYLNVLENNSQTWNSFL